ADVARSATFYRTLGLDVPEPPADQDHFEVTLPNGLRLMWDTQELIRQIDPAWQPPTGHHVALAFARASPADVDETYARLARAGATRPRDAVPRARPGARRPARAGARRRRSAARRRAALVRTGIRARGRAAGVRLPSRVLGRRGWRRPRQRLRRRPLPVRPPA